MRALIVLTAAPLALACAATDPFPPPEAAATPIPVDTSSVARVLFKGVVYDIEAGTHIGNLYVWRPGIASRLIDVDPVDQARWAGQPDPTEFNTIAERCLSDAGYPVERAQDQFFAGKSPDVLVIGAVVTRLWVDAVKRISSQGASYQNATIEARIKVYDPKTRTFLYDRAHIGYGTHKGIEPAALPVAFGNLLEHALADSTFVEAVRLP